MVDSLMNAKCLEGTGRILDGAQNEAAQPGFP